ncbi:MAG: CCA tRNA nucleotidyltransferase [uncultured Sphingomonas sp.]|uniref:CCA tRNA nucleotidyltransferase n=1 Tax=uncultured Sphingomonas sp. TaxID=158754 RepID=A0A6J4TTD2_9SPHN|nr:MAG: CCA tRNA nucleotidyltransferase [uncultured Sphingomonas sp.]
MELTRLDALSERPGIAQLLGALGPGSSRFVGGAVRDSLLGLIVQDIDLATQLSPYEVMRRCGAASIRTVPTGIEHGTVTAVLDGHPVEITTLRADVSTDGRRATVAFTDDWKADAERRDFTMNALYWDPEAGRLEDWFGGLDDLRAGQVRFIGEPLQRIAEDHLRILRFFRFHARFGRGAPDGPGLAACVERANDLMALSRERIADELLKLLALPNPLPTVRLMIEYRILAAVLPEIDATGVARLDRLIAAERSSAIEGDALRRLSALLAPEPLLAEKIAARLKLSNKARKRLALAADGDLDGNPRALAYWVGQEAAIDRLLLAGQAAEANQIAPWSPARLPISGGELIRRGLTPGPAIARTLKAIERRWVEEGFPDAQRLAQLVDEALATKSGL